MNFLRFSILCISFLGLTFFSCKQKKLERYTLEIKSLETTKSNNGKTDILVTTILSNNTDTTLKYFNMSCAWNTIYKTDNSNVVIVGPEACDSNYPISIILEPHKSLREDFLVLVNNKLNTSTNKFRVAINIIETKNYNGITEIPYSLHFNPSRKHGFDVWSNSIEIR